jgi:hypothetical protein
MEVNDRFIREEKAPGTHWIGGWVVLGVILDALKKRISWPYRESNLGRPVRSPLLYRPQFNNSISINQARLEWVHIPDCRNRKEKPLEFAVFKAELTGEGFWYMF